MIWFQIVIDTLSGYGLMLLFVIAATGFATKRKDRSWMGFHETFADGRFGIFNTTIFTLVVILISIFFLPPLDRSSTIFRIHLCCSLLAFTLLIAIKIRWNGREFKKVHPWLGYPCVIFGIGMNLLGAVIVNKIH